MSDINLKNLSSESGAPPPNTRGGKRGKNKRPNRGRHNTRISARRIGGPNYAADIEAHKRARELQAKKQAAMQPVNMGRSNKKTPPNGMNGTLPRVQELGGLQTQRSRRSSSRMRFNSGRNMGQASRKSSNTSNPSSTMNEAVGGPQAKEAIIRYGELFKKGVVTSQWKKRFFILTESDLLYYLETFDVPQELHQIELEPKGKIDLSVIEEVRKDKTDASAFQVFTPTRTYRLKLEAADDTARYGVSAWVASIRGACENAKQQNNSAGNNVPRASISSYKVDEMDEAIINASQYKHPAKRLIDAETMYTKQGRKGPHQPAALDEYEDWTPFDVAAWLYTVNLQKYSEDFYQQQVDGKILKKVTSEDEAKNLGVEGGDVTSFMAAVQTLKDMNLISDLPLGD